MTTMRVLALVPSLYDTSPGQRFRMEQWAPLLRKQGVDVSFEPFESEELHAALYGPGQTARKVRLVGRALVRRVRALRSVRDFDLVYCFREAALLGPAFFERWITLTGTPLVFDFDDAIFVPYVSPSNGYLSLLKFPGKTKSICRMSSHVMVGNAYLAEYAARVNSSVTIVPTTIDLDQYGASVSRPVNDPPVIGWSGSYSTGQHLKTITAALVRLARRDRFRLRVIGIPAFELDGVEVEAVPWRAATEVADLRVMDIGLMPLPDDQWSRGKCGLKALQYMALGVPTVCSPVGVNAEIIQDGTNGLLAGSQDQWVEKLSQLLRSAELRGKLGRAGRACVESRYAARVQAPVVHRILESVRRQPPRGESVPVREVGSLER